MLSLTRINWRDWHAGRCYYYHFLYKYVHSTAKWRIVWCIDSKRAQCHLYLKSSTYPYKITKHKNGGSSSKHVCAFADNKSIHYCSKLTCLRFKRYVAIVLSICWANVNLQSLINLSFSVDAMKPVKHFVTIMNLLLPLTLLVALVD